MNQAEITSTAAAAPAGTGTAVQPPHQAPEKSAGAAVKLDSQQLAAIDLMRGGNNVFLTGLAGTGKSTTVNNYVGSAFRRVDVTATTGIAAINLQDAFLARSGLLLKTSTLYRWAGINIGPRQGQSNEEFFKSLQNSGRNFHNACKRIMAAETLLIDEISMMPGRVLDYLDFHMRRIREKMMPFGGVQVIAVGDFLQLPPVAKNGNYDWAFKSRSWEAACFDIVNLNVIHRQNEIEFINALNDFREGRISGDTARLLAGRVARFPDREIPRLFTHNTQVNKWNTYQLECIEDEKECVYAAETSGHHSEIEFLEKNMITPFDLRIKRGARVMVTRNLPGEDGGLEAANGATGRVVSCAAKFGDKTVVALDSGQVVEIGPYQFSFDPTRVDSSYVMQYPLRLAYAMTIHKSQGLTLDRALIDIRAAREPGQAYVALSRLRSLGGLYLKDWIKGVFVSPDAINFYRRIL